MIEQLMNDYKEAGRKFRELQQRVEKLNQDLLACQGAAARAEALANQCREKLCQAILSSN